MQENQEIEVLEAEEVKEERKKKKGELALEEYRKNLTPEQRQASLDKARETRQKNQEEKRQIALATRALMSQKFKYRDHTGKLTYGNGYEARANALFLEVVGRGKNMIGAEKQLNNYLNEEKEEENIVNNQINVVFFPGQEFKA